MANEATDPEAKALLEDMAVTKEIGGTGGEWELMN
jgi:hypothetical protein